MLKLFHRDNCHLCEVMYAELLAWQAQNPDHLEPLELLDVDSRAEWAALLGNKVPVLFRDDEELCFGRLDINSLIAA